MEHIICLTSYFPGPAAVVWAEKHFWLSLNGPRESVSQLRVNPRPAGPPGKSQPADVPRGTFCSGIRVLTGYLAVATNCGALSLLGIPGYNVLPVSFQG